jgi:DNA-binding SARP family transcriptional activator
MLGPLEIDDGNDLVLVRGPNQQRLLILLAINANEAVPIDTLVDALWGDHPPAAPSHALHTTTTNARKRLARCCGRDNASARIEHLGWAYRLLIMEEELDTSCFSTLVDRSRCVLEGGDAETASQIVREALELWRGPALSGLGDEPAFQAEASRLRGLRFAALELRIDADLALGRHAELIGELEALTVALPFDEGLQGRLLLALYRAGRQVEALRAYQTFAGRLSEGLGIEPTPALQLVEQAILEQHPSVDAPRVLIGAFERRD